MNLYFKLNDILLTWYVVASFNALVTFQSSKACQSGFKESPGCLLEVQNCIYLWSEGGFIQLKLQKDERFNTILIDLPSNDTNSISATGTCPKANNVGNIAITYTNLKNVSKAVLTFIIKATDNDYWSVQNLSLQLNSKFIFFSTLN